MSTRYLVKLLPLAPFFFGGERSIGNEDQAEYFLHSNYFPQQTGILGLIRYQLLKQNNKLNQADTDLIGESSFDASIEKIQEFGKIKSISPIFIHYENGNDIKDFTTLSFDYGFKDNNPEPHQFTFKQKENGIVMHSFQKNFIPILEGYTAKDEYASLLVSSKGDEFKHFQFDKNKPDSNNGIFNKEVRVGITKNRKGEPDDDSFYRQTYYSLLSNYYFAFFIESEEKLDDGVIHFGKEKTPFKIESAPSDSIGFHDLFTKATFLFSNAKRSNQVILLSDCFCDNSIYEVCDFSITETQNFRNIITPNRVNNYGALDDPHSERTSFLKKSNKNTLLKRGSVLYGAPKNILSKLNHPNAKNIGFNQFITF
jgi:CRISPR-associated protein Cmr3